MPALLPLIAAAAAMTSVNVPDTLGSKLDRAVERSEIAVLVPETIKTEFKKAYGTLNSASTPGYDLVIGASKGCNGASVCGIATFEGEMQGRCNGGGERVDLAKNRKGFYFKSTCGANCSFPAIQWRERGALYTIRYKEATDSADMVKVANSAIKSGPR